MTARDVKRSALGMGRILLGVIMAICVPVWLVFSLVDYTRPTVPANELVTPSVEVHDETGSFEPIDGRPLTDVLGGVAFARPVHLVILSTDDLVDDNLDEATLKYARAGHKEWISPNGYKWADGYLILSVSPTYRKVGTYFGEDIAPLLSVQAEIQDAAKDDFRAGRWSEGIWSRRPRRRPLIFRTRLARALRTESSGPTGWDGSSRSRASASSCAGTACAAG